MGLAHINSGAKGACLTHVRGRVRTYVTISLSAQEEYRRESGPMKANTGDSMPIRVDSPALPQFPPSVKVVNTSFALLRGAKTQRVTRMAKKPKTCRIKISPSTMGRYLANTVLKKTAMKLIAIINKVLCHRS